jgi:hypothetical protein
MDTLYFFPAFFDLRNWIFIGLVLTMKKLYGATAYSDFRPVISGRLTRSCAATIDGAAS